MAGRHLYIIQSNRNGAIKIGRSDDPADRLKYLQTGSPYSFRLILVKREAGWEEPRVHQAMRRHRTRRNRGEWFKEDGMGDIPEDVWEHLMPWYLENPDWWKS